MKITLAVCEFTRWKRSQKSLTLLRHCIPIAAFHLALRVKNLKFEPRC